MAIAEIPDSEDDPFTSSPEAFPDGAVGQLDGTAEERPQDASSRGGDFPTLLGNPDVIKPAEHTPKTCNDKQQASLDDAQLLNAVAPANPESDMLHQCANELQISHRNVSSLTDIRDSSNQHSIAPTNSSSVQTLSKPENATETASSGSVKEQIIPADESVLKPTVETPYAASSPSCANNDSTATALNHDGQLVLPPVEDAVHPAYYGIASTVSTVEGGSPDTQPTRQTSTDLLPAEGDPLSQYGLPMKSHLGSYAGGSGAHNSSVNSNDTEGGGCSCSPSLSPADSSTSSNDHAPRRSTTTGGETLTKPDIQYGEREDTGSSKVHSSKNEDSIQLSISNADNSNMSLRNITMEHIRHDSSAKSAQPSTAPKQQCRVEGVGGHDMAHPGLVVSADLAPNLFSTRKPAEVHISEVASNEEPNTPHLVASNTTLQRQNEAREAAAIKSRFQNRGEHVGSSREIVPSPVVEVAATEPTLNAFTQSSSSAVSIAEDSQSTLARSPQEVTMAEMKAKRAALIASLAHLPAIQDILADTRSSGVSSSMPDAEPTESEIMAAAHQINKKHIRLLHEYNELKDVGQGLMGLIADQRGVRIVEVQGDFGIDAKD
ncbi:hypothetical protein PMIN06_006519 [Paraphaeosphaeria minitans]|uniref:Swi5-domain-containing protein n=1 Tax=Paraphaeosphaeria minitans TaxID=565426 RepID=A0A9P6GEM9_9PLEO|nr:hypothetical protein PMIN01_08021 [Paraphaeosphaeria minitans]